MSREQVEAAIMYYRGIPGMVKLLKKERAETEEEYNGLRGSQADGLPRGSSPGNPTAKLAERAEEKGLQNRLCEIDIRLQILSGDRATIRGCLDLLRGRYKRVIFLRCLDRYSWAKIAAEIGVPDSTARHWYRKALDRMEEALEDVPMAEEILARASRARE